jgi:hypothetical protein
MALIKGTNCGFVTSAPSADPAASNELLDTRGLAFKDTSPATATKVTEIGVYVDNATEAGDIDLAIYTHNAGDDNPEAIVTAKATIAKGTTSGWKKATGLNITISSSTIYWIAAQLDNTATATNTNAAATGGEKLDRKLSQTELTDPWGASGDTQERLLAVYAVWEAAPVGNAGIMTTNTGYWGPTF